MKSFQPAKQTCYSLFNSNSIRDLEGKSFMVYAQEFSLYSIQDSMTTESLVSQVEVFFCVFSLVFATLYDESYRHSCNTSVY